ncbi:MAG: hypothetical protein ACRECH_00560 [Nitrososphaerales archaeon]
MNQTPLSCDWCGKFVVSVADQKTGSGKLFEIYTDESGRLIKDENDLFAVTLEHKCKVVCASCGSRVIMEQGEIYDRPSYDDSKIFTANERETLLFRGKNPHKCPRN